MLQTVQYFCFVAVLYDSFSLWKEEIVSLRELQNVLSCDHKSGSECTAENVKILSSHNLSASTASYALGSIVGMKDNLVSLSSIVYQYFCEKM